MQMFKVKRKLQRIRWSIYGPIYRKIILPIKLKRYGKECKQCKRKYIPPPYKTRFSCATIDYCAGCAYDMDSQVMSEEEQWGYGEDWEDDY
ncbi:hypothetical protein CEE45_01675 [Candidatus Heimdallarchaeota archaeon B3_Heim]|nr:MAG: hypothetical protein CEE45_01675 [Candidatus Heimdallarchaeota archaeon B3_Heim]